MSEREHAWGVGGRQAVTCDSDAARTHSRELVAGVQADVARKDVDDGAHAQRLWRDVLELHALEEASGREPVVAHRGLDDLDRVVLEVVAHHEVPLARCLER